MKNRAYNYYLTAIILSAFVCLMSCDTHVLIDANYKIKYYHNPSLAADKIMINKAVDKRFDENSSTDLRYNVGNTVAPLKDGSLKLNVPLPEFVKKSMNAMWHVDKNAINTLIDVEINKFSISVETSPFTDHANFQSEMVFYYKDKNGNNLSYKSSIDTPIKYDNNKYSYAEAVEFTIYKGMVEVEKDFMKYYEEHK